jgi:hypothetical protein
MANAAADMDRKPAWAGRGSRINAAFDVAIGGSGAASVAYADDNKFTCTKNNTGIYDLLFPACPRARATVDLLSPSLTVTHYAWTAWSATAGTATLKTLKNDVAAEPASGDILRITFFFDSENV